MASGNLFWGKEGEEEEREKCRPFISLTSPDSRVGHTNNVDSRWNVALYNPEWPRLP